MSVSPASLAAQAGCEREIPIEEVPCRDANTSPVVDAETASPPSELCARILFNRSAAEMLEISGFQPSLDLYPDRESALREEMA